MDEQTINTGSRGADVSTIILDSVAVALIIAIARLMLYFGHKTNIRLVGIKQTLLASNEEMI